MPFNLMWFLERVAVKRNLLDKRTEVFRLKKVCHKQNSKFYGSNSSDFAIK